MKASRALLLTLAVITSVVVSVALALAAATEEPTETHTMVIALGGGERTEIDLGDLADGESRTFPLEKGLLTATRRGEKIEMMIDNGDGEGEPRHLELTLGRDKATRLVIAKPGGKGSASVTVTGEAGHGMSWVSEDGEVTALGHGEGSKFISSDGKAVTVVTHRICVKDDEKGSGDETVVMLSGKDDDGKVEVWFSRGDDQAVFTCPDDETRVVVDSDKVPAAGVACPICGKLMDRVETPHAHSLVTECEKRKLL